MSSPTKRRCAGIERSLLKHREQHSQLDATGECPDGNAVTNRPLGGIGLQQCRVPNQV